MSDVTILHSGPRYIARLLRCDDRKSAVVCFEYWKPKPTLEGEFAAEGFFRHRGLNAIGIMSSENDWFQDDEILAVLASIRAATASWRLVGYGGSMGGFAVINFAGDLGLQSLVAVVPQFSIDSTKAPYESRWREEASRSSFGHDKIDRVRRISQGWIVFDPWCVDGQHAAMIQKHHSLGEVRVHLGGHGQMLVLQQADLYSQLLLDLLEDTFDPLTFRLKWRTARRKSAAFWVSLAQILLGRGWADASLNAIRQARCLPHPEPAVIDMVETDALAASGNVAGAQQLAVKWADDTIFGPAAGAIFLPVHDPIGPFPMTDKQLEGSNTKDKNFVWSCANFIALLKRFLPV